MLSSWKEIAHFFGKGVRTVQRWEKTLDLPIHRPPGAPSNVVLARTSDLEDWMHRGSVLKAVQEESAAESLSDTTLSSISALEMEIESLAAWIGVPLPDEAKSVTLEERIKVSMHVVRQIRSAVSEARSVRAA